jgi:HAD superfamily hydrolase (TIGR01509 family)
MPFQREMPFQHVIFDCDGVLVDSEAISMHAEARLLTQLGAPCTANELHDRFVGRTSHEIWSEMAAERGLSLPADFTTWYEDQLEAVYRAELQSVAGVPAMLAQLALPVSCASNSTRRMLRLKLALTGLDHHFSGRLHSADDVAKPKPAPELYLRAASQVGVEPMRCVVVEDSPTGARAALAAGMTVLGFIGAYAGQGDAAQELRAVGVEQIFADMAQLPELVMT